MEKEKLLRDRWTDGTGIEGSTRDPRGPEYTHYTVMSICMENTILRFEKGYRCLLVFLTSPNWATKCTNCPGKRSDKWRDLVKFRVRLVGRDDICHSRHCWWQCKIFASGVNFFIFTNFFVLFWLRLLKLGEIDGVKLFVWKSGGVNFLTNIMSELCRWKNCCHQKRIV